IIVGVMPESGVYYDFSSSRPANVEHLRAEGTATRARRIFGTSARIFRNLDGSVDRFRQILDKPAFPERPMGATIAQLIADTMDGVFTENLHRIDGLCMELRHGLPAEDGVAVRS